VRVLDLSTVIAAPLAAMILGDYGAEVTKIEHPHGGDPARTHGYDKDGTPLWWLMLGRNKRSVTLYLGDPEGQQILRDLAVTADVVENFRPGVMEAWGLGYADLSRENPGLIMAHISGFGRSGPLASEPGFGTIGEVMSGFAFRNGDADGPPMLPPFGLGDGVAGISLALGVVTALYERNRSGLGQEIDLAIIESLLMILEPQLSTQNQLGHTLARTGNQAEMNAPRGLYLAGDGEWVAISASTASTAERLMELVGDDDLHAQPWFSSAQGRRAHVSEIDAAIDPWVSKRSAAEVVAELRAAKVPVAPVFSAQDILDDPQFAAIGSVGTFPDARLGQVRMPNMLFRMSATPGHVDWLGPELGAHTDEVLAKAGVSDERRAALRTRRVV
jgi:formyl-CoA transferase